MNRCSQASAYARRMTITITATISRTPILIPATLNHLAALEARSALSGSPRFHAESTYIVCMCAVIVVCVCVVAVARVP